MNKDKDQIDRKSDDTVAKLMSLAGPRADIEADRQSRVHDKVRQEWLRSTRKKTRARWLAPVALAASVLLVVALNIRSPETPLLQIGTVSYVATNAAGSQGAPKVGDPVHAGDVIETGDLSGLSVSLPGDISLRVAAGTAIRFDQDDEFTLFNGQVYADTGDQIYRDRPITIHTAVGSATDIGTQFSVSYVNNRLDVTVREGRVDVANDRNTYTAEAGDKLSVDPGDGVVRGKVTSYDASWQWASSLAPEFDIENKSLLEFLKWGARETGMELTFSSDELRMGAMGTKLFGSVRGFAPADAIESVLSTTRFRYRIDEQSITILE
ncbi:MAG: FecR family protein [Gammaproteobacteria bacterium]|jgi:ferric-dicitrate binding protein FerR (iron transport regulator)|nr:FecR family protein [Gammaproteobacteria bacterium]